MGIKSFNAGFTGQVGIAPRRLQMVTTDNLATITAAGYLKNERLAPMVVMPTDVLDVIYSYSEATNSGTYEVFLPSFSGSVITLNPDISGGNVTLPVVANDFANFDGTSGKIKDSGYSPSDAAKTKVVMLNAAPAGLNLASYSNVDGTLGDSGILPAAVQLKANIKAATTANIGGAGAGPISVVVAGATAASVVVATIESSSNAVSVLNATATATGFNVTFSGDPGASCLLNYVLFIAAQ